MREAFKWDKAANKPHKLVFDSHLRIIAKIVHQYRDDISCQTSGVHQDAARVSTSSAVKPHDITNMPHDVRVYCETQGWDFQALIPK